MTEHDKHLAVERELREVLDEARRLLRLVQWQAATNNPGLERDTCPVCGGVAPEFIGGSGHDPDCRLKRALG